MVVEGGRAMPKSSGAKKASKASSLFQNSLQEDDNEEEEEVDDDDVVSVTLTELEGAAAGGASCKGGAQAKEAAMVCTLHVWSEVRGKRRETGVGGGR